MADSSLPNYLFAGIIAVVMLILLVSAYNTGFLSYGRSEGNATIDDPVLYELQSSIQNLSEDAEEKEDETFIDKLTDNPVGSAYNSYKDFMEIKTVVKKAITYVSSKFAWIPRYVVWGINAMIFIFLTIITLSFIRGYDLRK